MMPPPPNLPHRCPIPTRQPVKGIYVKAYKLKYIKDRRVSLAKGINADKGTKIQTLHELIKQITRNYIEMAM